tara:strand:+ start:514 stop:1014 length:501 start_codon:yes stop_codon:yes gene_type:complete
MCFQIQEAKERNPSSPMNDRCANEDHGLEVYDHGEEVVVSEHRSIRWIYIVLGSISVAIGVIGIFVPGLPTTIFLIMAAAAYARSSDRLYWWLLNNKLLGKYVRDWERHKSITLPMKIFIVFMIALMTSISALFAVSQILVKIIILSAGLVGVWYVALHTPTRNRA